MAVDVSDPDSRARISRVVRHAFEMGADERRTRERLMTIYEGSSALAKILPHSKSVRNILINYFQQFVTGRLTTLAASAPKWMVKAKTNEGKGLDKRISALLNRYSQVLGLHEVFTACALDSAFGRAVVKIITSVAPKGVTSPLAPRAYRISPDDFFVDRATKSSDFNNASFMGDVYLVPLDEAKGFEGFDPALRESLSAYKQISTSAGLPPTLSSSSNDIYVEDMVRLVDVYFPTSGLVATWPAANDHFGEIGSQPPLQAIPSPINPYVIFQGIRLPNSLGDYAPLQLIEELHFLANDMLHKAAQQARASRRHPIGAQGEEADMNALLSSQDNAPVFLERPEAIGLYTIPGPDPSLLSLMSTAGQLLSSSAGNLQVALGQSPGASTARQTQAILGQINSVQDLDRTGFETFIAQVGEGIATLAFSDEAFELRILQEIPGTNMSFNLDWAPPSLLPRVAAIDSFMFEVVPFSTKLRSPEERTGQLMQASNLVFQMFGLASQGAPINLEAVLNDVAESFDLVVGLPDWWSGEPPTPAESTQNAYTSLAPPAQGSTISYESNSSLGAGGSAEAAAPPPGGLQNA